MYKINNFGGVLRNLRIKKGLSQEDVANILGLKRSAISMYEQNNSHPNLETFIDLVNYFGVEPGYFFHETNNEIVTKTPEIDYKEKYYKCVEEKSELMQKLLDLK